jgi:hydroxyethylthiazole kinase-like uncharacterized protein yjeF
VLIIGGSREIPGAVLLAATAALRAGAGKLTVATAASVAIAVAVALPEARVISLRETKAGALCFDARPFKDQTFDAVLIGPGTSDERGTTRFTLAALKALSTTRVILDAYAMSAVAAGISRASSVKSAPSDVSILLTPHAGELAHLSGAEKDVLLADPVKGAMSFAAQSRAIVALKGATTVIAAPDGSTWRHEVENIGLAVSGSGDTLAGIIAGLAARGASLEQAAAWGVFVHARAGAAAARRHSLLGYLAREIVLEVPRVLAMSSRPANAARSGS